VETNGTSNRGQDVLLKELESIRDVYQRDVKQFVAFVREGKLHIVDGFRQYAKWLEEEHEGKRYSPATVNRKLAAARNRVRYAFKHSGHAGSLQRKYRLEDILKSVKLKKIDPLAVSTRKALRIEEARKLVGQTKDRTIRLMVTFLVRTGVRVSEMLGIKLTDLVAVKGELVHLRVRGKAGKERLLYVKKDFMDLLREHFSGTTYLFEHHGRPYNRISVTNRIKHESLKILGREVSAQQLRHTWAAIQIKKGRGVSAVAAAMGRADPGSAARMSPDSALKPEDAFLDLSKTDNDGGAIGD
jgi:integrase/recombinase XerD